MPDPVSVEGSGLDVVQMLDEFEDVAGFLDLLVRWAVEQTPGAEACGLTLERAGRGAAPSGFAPGCERPFPIIMVTPLFGTGEASAGFGSMACATGDLNLQVNTANSAGTGTDKTFSFTLFSGDGPVPPALARQAASADVCELTETGVHCH